VRFATYAVQLEPSPRPATRLQLARSEFALGHFAGAAASYRALLEYYIREKETIDPVILHAYADALGSLPGHAAAAQEFQGVFRPVRPVTWEGDTFLAQAKVEEAGLLLMAGDASLARQLSERPFTAGAQAFAPEFMARLGWWYYRAGQYDAADKLIRRFLTLRPGDKGLQSALGWLAIERNAPAEALRLFEYIPVEDEPWRSVRAGYLIAQWRLRQTDSAVAGFEQLEKAGPQWKNPAWIKAFYGPVAVQSLEEMRAEEDRRIAARRAH
jgi:tetratricopeptide (TPR) repeat protein